MRCGSLLLACLPALAGLVASMRTDDAAPSQSAVPLVAITANAPDSLVTRVRAAMSCLLSDECGFMCADHGAGSGACREMQCFCERPPEFARMLETEAATTDVTATKPGSFTLVDNRQRTDLSRASKAWFVLQMTVGALAASVTLVFLFWLYGRSENCDIARGTKCYTD